MNKQRVLLVDDERQITRVLSRSLAAKGYDVHVATDGEMALQTFNDWPPDLVVTDLNMPNINGLELCRRLRAFSEVPIIVLSVKGEERTKIEALDAGADDYVTNHLELTSYSRESGQRFDEGLLTRTIRETLSRSATFKLGWMNAE